MNNNTNNNSAVGAAATLFFFGILFFAGIMGYGFGGLVAWGIESLVGTGPTIGIGLMLGTVGWFAAQWAVSKGGNLTRQTFLSTNKMTAIPYGLSLIVVLILLFLLGAPGAAMGLGVAAIFPIVSAFIEATAGWDERQGLPEWANEEEV
jgi:hypothetical protein